MPVRGIKSLTSAISKLVDEKLNQLYNKTKNEIVETSRNVIRGALKNHDTYTLIANGVYNNHLGFYPGTGESRMLTIVETVVNTLDIKLIRFKNVLKIEAFIDYATLYSLNEAKVINDSKRAGVGKTEAVLDWLEWILEAGGKVVVQNYHIDIDDYSNSTRSRSGEAIMVERGQWSVPSDIQGTVSNNWITQSFEDAEKKLSPAIKRIISNELKRLFG